MADMKDKKLNDNEMEQVSGGSALDVLETAGKGFFSGGFRVLCVFGIHQWRDNHTEYSGDGKMLNWDRTCKICGKHDVGHI
jgi:bacteriocin-like protein